MASGGKKSGNVKEFEKRQCRSSEQPHLWATGWIGNMMGKGDDKQRNGALIVTNERVVFYLKGMMSEVCESIPLNRITSVSFSKTMAKSELTVHAPGNELEFKSLEAGATAAIREALDRVVAGEPMEAMFPPEVSEASESADRVGAKGAAASGTPVKKKRGLFKRVMLWSVGGMVVLFALAAILPKKDDVSPSEPDAAGTVVAHGDEQPAADATDAEAPTPSDATRTYTLTSFERECLEASQSDWNSNCAGASFEAELFVMNIGQDGSVLLRSDPVSGGTQFNVSFADVPDWGSDPDAWLNRKAAVSGVLSDRKPTFIGVAFLEQARIVDWLDATASENAARDASAVLEANRAEDAPWRTAAVEALKSRPDVIEAAWAHRTELRVAVANTGSIQDELAQSFCQVLADAGKMDGNRVIVALIDIASLNNAQPVEVGMAGCP